MTKKKKSQKQTINESHLKKFVSETTWRIDNDN